MLMRSTRPQQIEIRNAPVGDENVQYNAFCLFNLIEIRNAPVGDENIFFNLYELPKSIEIRNAPVGDENSLLIRI